MKHTTLSKIPGLLLLVLAAVFGATACEDYLDEKPSKSQVIPTTLSELEGLLNDNALGMNKDLNPGHMAVDDFELTPGAFMQLSQLERNSYLWEPDPFLEDVSSVWASYYRQIYNANLALEGLEKLKDGQSGNATIGHLRGKCLFTKAQAYFFLLQAYSDPYDPLSSDEKLGVPIRNTTDINIGSVRPSLEESYREAEQLLIQSLEYLPERDESRKTPSRWAAYALMSRLYLIMGSYENALESADKALSIGDELFNYNDLNPDDIYPFPEFGMENIYNVTLGVRAFWTSTGTAVAADLYASYDSTDLRKYLFFEESPEEVMIFKGSYTGNYEKFSGYSVNELYLTKAECLARLGRFQAASETIDSLLRVRYAEGEYENVGEVLDTDLLGFILAERRKELVFRNIRWLDLRRLNNDEKFQKTLTRTIAGQSYSLEPESYKYVFPIPMDEIRLNGLIQNPGYN
ncbi:tetratricopeptide (TPR) repeat protein [Algoriphagus sp. 4150]|uniref:RagB/SusD family nutrient uptake outer membrane protein n=1 Tax=Algoriphagus sp. 4150 TaxID=2817756 RepID=UPI00285F576E|nr:RagB/SusD family nutrient uptake outer membrane protein [Algoriphagus sp. 4150]MDR7130986.1 tetratricopeptide (TPR) repeat protein [Algoriphagus sp. 4150]